MVAKEKLLSPKQDSPPNPETRVDRLVEKKKKMYKPSKVTVEHFGGNLDPKFPRSPRNLMRESRSYDALQSRPSPRRTAAFSVSPIETNFSDSLRSTRAVKSPKPKTMKSPKAQKSPTSTKSAKSLKAQTSLKSPRSLKPQPTAKSPRSLKPHTTAKSPRSIISTRSQRSMKSQSSPRSTSSTKSPKSLRSSKSVKSTESTRSRSAYLAKREQKLKNQPLLSDDEVRDAAPTEKASTQEKETYAPPTMTSSNATTKGKTTDETSATGSARNAVMDKRETRQPPVLAAEESMDSTPIDRYATAAPKEQPSRKYRFWNKRSQAAKAARSTVREIAMENASGVASSREGGRPAGLFTNGALDGSDTYGDDTYADESYSVESREHKRGLMRYHFSNLSDNTSYDEGSVIIKQQVAWGCIFLSAVHFAILTTQVLLCGIAALSINPTIGPYPDAFSEWGGKNTYLLVESGQYYRFITPTFLHVGYLHLLVNVFFQLETCAYLEREWGFITWISIYLLSGFGSSMAASAIDPDIIGVCSSGALMGLFGARIAQAIMWTVFETNEVYSGQGGLIIERLGGTLCSAAVVFLLTCLTYIDWSGHLGGMFTGFLVGLIAFTFPLRGAGTRATLRLIGLCALAVGGTVLGVVLFHYVEADEELADACDYFRNLYSEGYVCECVLGSYR